MNPARILALLLPIYFLAVVILQPIARAQQLPPSLIEELKRSQKPGAPDASRGAPEQDKGEAKKTLIERPVKAGPTPLSPFEVYVNQVMSGMAGAGQSMRRFGQGLIRDEEPTFSPNFDFAIPPDYVIGPGDQLLVRSWGSIEGETLRTVDRRGRINLPTVGEISLAGLRYDQVEEVVRARYTKYFKEFSVSVSIERLRGIRVFITGFAANPGSYTVSNLSTVLNVFLASGGPGPGGSFRDIQLIRGGQVLSTLDSYEFLMAGIKAQDRLLQSGDVIRVGETTKQVAIGGAVNRPAIYELKRGETVNDLLAMAGGFTELAEQGFLRLLEFQRREAGFGDLVVGAPRQPHPGDVYFAVNSATLRVPSTSRSLRVRIDGEVNRPGEYLLPPGADIADAIASAGNFSSYAFPYGLVMTRLSARREQSEQLERIKREMEASLNVTSARTVSQTTQESAANAERTASIMRLINRLDATVSAGRVNLNTSPWHSRLPNFGLEDGDEIYVPRVPEVRGVYGAVLNPGTFSSGVGDTVESVLRAAGGLSETADASRVLVIRANGTAEKVSLTGSLGLGFFGGRDLKLLPGDTVFVSEDVRPQLTFTQELREWTQILSQFALGAAAIKVLRD